MAKSTTFLENMDLIKWTELSKAKKLEQIQTWIAEDHLDDYAHLATEAAELLNEKTGPINCVSSVMVEDGPPIVEDKDRPVSWLILVVYTTLGNNEVLGDIPSEFHGFSVNQISLGDKRLVFTSVVTDVFRELLSWDESRTLAWLEDGRWSDGLDGRRPPLIYHDGPLKTAAYGLSEEAWFENHNIDKIHLRNSILKAICDGARGDQGLHPTSVAGYDWERIRKEYQSILAQGLK